MSLEFRQGTVQDFDWIWELRREGLARYVEEALGRSEEVQHLQFRENFTPELWQILIHDGDEVGAQLAFERPQELYLAYVLIAPAFRDRGLGSIATRLLQSRSAELGIPFRLHVMSANTKAAAFYERLGFKLIGEAEGRKAYEWQP